MYAPANQLEVECSVLTIYMLHKREDIQPVLGSFGDFFKVIYFSHCLQRTSCYVTSSWVSSRGGRGEASPPKHLASPPQKKKRGKRKKRKRRKKEREREREREKERLGSVYYLGIMIIHVNNIPPKNR